MEIHVYYTTLNVFLQFSFVTELLPFMQSYVPDS